MARKEASAADVVRRRTLTDVLPLARPLEGDAISIVL